MRVRDNEPIGTALRRFKKLLDRSGVWREIRHADTYHEPPGQQRRTKQFKKRLKARLATLAAQRAGAQPCASLKEAVATLEKRTGKR